MANEKMTGNVRVVRNSQAKRQMSEDMLRALDDHRLSWGALGLYNYICNRLPENEEFTLEYLQGICPIADPQAVAEYYVELVEFGYIQE